MNTCESHDDAIVVHEGRNCPCCQAESDLNDAIRDLESRVDTATDTVQELQQTIKELENGHH
jgi:prefoldin subunit 5